MVKTATRRVSASKKDTSKTGVPRETAQNKRFYTKRTESDLTTEKQGFLFHTFQVHSTFNDIELLKDSGCTSHIIEDAEMFRDLDVTKTGKIECTNGTESNIEGGRSLSFFAKHNQGQNQTWELEKSLHVPQYTKNLVSIKKLNEQNASGHFDAKLRLVVDGKRFPLMCETNVFHLQVDYLPEQSNAAVASLQIWHERLGHYNKINVRNLAKTAVDMKLVDDGN